MKGLFSVFAVFLCVVFGFVPTAAAIDCRAPTVLMSLPDRPENPFWGPYAKFAEAVAESLGVRLIVGYSEANDRFDYAERLREALSGPETPDYVAAFPYFGAVPFLMDETAKRGTAVITLNSDLGPADRKAVGNPRENYPNWLMQSLADDESAGYLLAQAVTQAARRRFNLEDTASVRINAIGGNQIAASSLQRLYGLERFVGEAGRHSVINQFVFTDWSYDRGREVAEGLFKRYAETDVVWTASLPLGLAAVDSWLALANRKISPAIGVISGPFDERALSGVEDGTFSAVVGGHFLEGGIVLALLLDHFNGLDFADDIGTTLRIPFEAIDQNNIERIRLVLGKRNWSGVDFRHLSKCHNAARKRYDFSLETVLQR